MTSNFLEDRVDDILESILETDSDNVYLINPTAPVLETFVRVATAIEDRPVVRLLADERTLKDVLDDFIVASNAADLVDDGVLEIRTQEAAPQNALAITDDAVVALVEAGDRFAGLGTQDESFAGVAREAYTAEWEAAEPFGLRTPALSVVTETLESDIGPTAEADFSDILNSLETARGDGDGLDEVTISLLVAARNEALLYDISKWGEDVGIASKATFSRTKTRLEDMGLIDTEKVPIDVGRPRLRLKIADDRLAEADSDQIATVTQSILT